MVQRAWLLKLLALELHVGNVTLSNHREVCHSIVAHLFGQGGSEYDSEHNILLQSSPEDAANRAIGRCKVHCSQLVFIIYLSLYITLICLFVINIYEFWLQVLELLEIMQFRSPDTTTKHSEVLSDTKFGPVVSTKL